MYSFSMESCHCCTSGLPLLCICRGSVMKAGAAAFCSATRFVAMRTNITNANRRRMKAPVGSKEQFIGCREVLKGRLQPRDLLFNELSSRATRDVSLRTERESRDLGVVC